MNRNHDKYIEKQAVYTLKVTRPHHVHCDTYHMEEKWFTQEKNTKVDIYIYILW